MKPQGSVASLVEALREEVETEVARIRRETEEEERRACEAAAAEPVELPDRLERLGAERRKAAELLAREDWADRREALEEREAFIAEAARAGLALLTQPETPESRRDLLTCLIAEALEHLPGDAFEVALPTTDATITDRALMEELAKRCGKREVRLSAEPLHAAGGCIVRTADGRASFDNTFDARSRRFEAVWRAALAEVYGP